MRSAVLAALMLTACAAQETPAPQALFKPNDFTVAGDACGASEYARLVGEDWGAAHQAALPADARVIRHILAADGRIEAIGCF